MKNSHNIYLISDSTGETLDRIFLALKAQFPNFQYETNHFSFTRTESQTLSILKQAKEITKIPIVGIGGINQTNVESVKNTGADAICIVSEITKAKNPEQVINNINNILNN